MKVPFREKRRIEGSETIHLPIYIDSGTEQDVNSRMKKAKGTLFQLCSTWKERELGLKKKVGIFKSHVKDLQ